MHNHVSLSWKKNIHNGTAENALWAAWRYQEVHRVVKSHCTPCGFSFRVGLKLAFQPCHGNLKQGQCGCWCKRSQLSEGPGRGALVPTVITALFGSMEALCCALIPLIRGTYSRVLTDQAHTLILLCGLELISTDDTCTLIPLSLL